MFWHRNGLLTYIHLFEELMRTISVGDPYMRHLAEAVHVPRLPDPATRNLGTAEHLNRFRRDFSVALKRMGEELEDIDAHLSLDLTSYEAVHKLLAEDLYNGDTDDWRAKQHRHHTRLLNAHAKLKRYFREIADRYPVVKEWCANISVWHGQPHEQGNWNRGCNTFVYVYKTLMEIYDLSEKVAVIFKKDLQRLDDQHQLKKQMLTREGKGIAVFRQNVKSWIEAAK